MEMRLTTPQDLVLNLEVLVEKILKSLENQFKIIKPTLNKEFSITLRDDNDRNYPTEALREVCERYKKAGWGSVTFHVDQGSSFRNEQWFNVEFVFKV